MMKNYNKAPLIIIAVLLLLAVVVAASGLLLLTADAFSYSSSYTTAGVSSALLCRHCHYSGADNNNNNNNNNNNKSLVLFLSSSTDDDDDDDDGDNINNNKRKIPTNSILETRRGTFQRIVSEGATATAAVFVTAAAATATATRANAADADAVVVATTTTTTTNDNDNKQYNLSDEEIMKIISNDIIENQFLVNGQLTRNIYDEKCTFQDEIDTYELNKWISGTSKLFDSTRSKVLMVNNSLKPMSNNNEGIEFRFVEYLCFNIPFVKPIVFLSGTLELKRNKETGLITSYQEKWDQNIYMY
jgi:hypothetical protein